MMRFTAALMAVAMVVTVAGCDKIPGTKEHAIERGKELAARDLIDPESAQFRDVVAFKAGPAGAGGFRTPGGYTVCGEINGKNRMGGYVGFKKFAVDIESGQVLLESSEVSSRASADEVAAAGYNDLALDTIIRTGCGPLAAL